MADLQEQLQLSLSLNKSIQERSKLIAEQTGLLKNQTDVAWELFSAIEKIDADQLKSKILETRDAINSLREAADQAETSFETMSTSAIKASDQVKQLGTSAKVAFGAIMTWKVGGLVVSSIAQKMASLGVLIATIIKGFVGVSKSIISIPFKLLKGFLDFSYELGTIDVITRTFEDVRKVLGDLQQGSGELIKKSLRPMQEEFGKLSAAGHGFASVFGYGREGVANALKFNTELFERLNGAALTLRRELTENIAALAIYRKGLGLTAEQQAIMIRFTDAQGRAAVDGQQELAKYSLMMGKRFGFSAKEMGQTMASLRADIGNYGTLTTKQLSQVTAYTKMLGIETKSLQGLISKYDDFESAAQSAAMLNQTFGMQVDVLKMLREEDPAARLSYLQRSFQATGRSYENLSRAERKRLADLSGLDDAAAHLAFSQKGLGMSYEEVMAAGDQTDNTFKDLNSTLKELSRNIEKIFRDPQRYQSFFHAFIGGFQKGIALSSPFMKTMKDMQDAIKRVEAAGQSVGKIFVKYFPGMQQFFTAIHGFLQQDFIDRRLASFKDNFEKFIHTISDPKQIRKALRDLITNLSKDFVSHWSGQGGLMTEAMEGVKKFGSTIGNIIINMLDIIMHDSAKVFNAFTAWLKDPNKSLKEAFEDFFGKDAFNGLLAGLNDEFGESLRGLWKTFKTEFWPAAKELTAELTDVLIDKFFDISFKVMGAFADGLWRWAKDNPGKLVLAAMAVGTVFAVKVGAAIVAGIATAMTTASLVKSLLGATTAANTAGAAAGSGFVKSFSAKFLSAGKTFISSAGKTLLTGAKAVAGTAAAKGTALVGAGAALGLGASYAIWGDDDRKHLDDMWGDEFRKKYGDDAAKAAIESATRWHIGTGRIYYANRAEALKEKAEKAAIEYAKKNKIEIPPPSISIDASSPEKSMQEAMTNIENQSINQNTINNDLAVKLVELEKTYVRLSEIDFEKIEKSIEKFKTNLPSMDDVDVLNSTVSNYISQINFLFFNLEKQFSRLNTKIDLDAIKHKIEYVSSKLSNIEKLNHEKIEFSNLNNMSSNMNGLHKQFEEFNNTLRLVSSSTYTSREEIAKIEENLNFVNYKMMKNRETFEEISRVAMNKFNDYDLHRINNRLNSAMDTMSNIQSRFNEFLQDGVGNLSESFTVRMDDLKSSIAAISTIYDAYTRLIPENAIAKVNALVDEVTSMEAKFASVSHNKTFATVVEIGKALQGNSQISFKHENLQLNLQVKVEMSAEQIADGIIRLDKVNGEDFEHNFTLGRRNDSA
jgi:hypothetical protein